jgi:hypothetical protein
MILLAFGNAMEQKHLSDLVVSPVFRGGTIKWYDAATGGNLIPGTAPGGRGFAIHALSVLLRIISFYKICPASVRARITNPCP